MARARHKKNTDLPKGVYRTKRGKFIYREYKGRIDGKTVSGPEITLCPVDAPRSVLWAAYERVTGIATDTLSWLLEEYHKSAEFQDLDSQDTYEDYRISLCSKPVRGGTFGGIKLIHIKPTTIKKYLTSYEHKGIKRPVAANRRIQYLKAAWNCMLQYHDEIPSNPCTGVKLNKEEARERYIEDWEYKRVMEIAGKVKNAYVPVFMELAYLCRARAGEVARLRVDDILPEGVRLIRGKGSEGEITTWTPRLRAAVQMARELNPDAVIPIKGEFLIHNARGQKFRKNTLDSAWQRAKKGFDFTFHDIKAKAYSDQDEQFAGHKSDKMHKTYNRKLRRVEATE